MANSNLQAVYRSNSIANIERRRSNRSLMPEIKTFVLIFYKNITVSSINVIKFFQRFWLGFNSKPIHSAL